MHDILTEIWQTARRNKLRTTLTGFAVAWGIFMIIVLLGAGNGLINATMKMSSDYLTNSIEVSEGVTSMPYKGMKEGRYIQLNRHDMEATETEFKENVDEVGACYYTTAMVTYGENYKSIQIAGVYPVHTQIVKTHIICGRFINDIDQKERRKVLVLADSHAKELEPKDYKTLLGKFVKVGNFSFKVVGIYKSRDEGWGNAYSSYSAIKTIYGANTPSMGGIEFTFHGLNTVQANEDFEKGYRRRLNGIHQAHPDDKRAIWIWNNYTQSLQMNDGIAIIHTFLWVIGLFTLLSGIVGVSNIMLITVKERTHEFGIRKAIGAKPRSILRLIITESVIITTLFGYVGMLCGIFANEYMDATLGHEVTDLGVEKLTLFVNPTVGLDVCIEATMVMVIAGTIAGLIPAYKASRIRPIEALRAD
ncbi:MAG: ABC transporter permease [Prevotella sp.]|jgi:putative ABC transport system permease protein|nr:ABC transporter permease [Prevotella sp.]